MKYLNLFLFSFFFSVSVFSQSVGIGTTTPDASAMLEVKSFSKGLLIPRMSSAQMTGIASPATGLMIYNTGNNDIWFYNGSAWLKTNLWTQSAPGKFYATNSGDFVGIGLSNPLYQFHVLLYDGSITSNPMMALENNFGTGYSSMMFASSGSSNFTMGLDITEFDAGGNTGTFKIVKGSTLIASTQGDGSTMIRTFSSGITDINNQSRCRVFQERNNYINNDPNGEYGQAVKNSHWTPVYFTIMRYDQHSEFALMPYPLVPPMTPAAYSGGTNPPAYFIHQFTALESGYYQVNARVDFAYKKYTVINDSEAEVSVLSDAPDRDGYVSIAIMKKDLNGVNIMYSQGNKLMGAQNVNNEVVEQNNLAPNVSDVVYLKAGESISIWVWQSISTNPIPLRVRNPDSNPWVFPVDHDFPTQVYVSIHKSS